MNMKIFKIIGVAQATERSVKSFTFIFLGFYLSFESNFTIKRFMNDFWNYFRRTLTMAASSSVFYIAVDYKNKPNMKVAASRINNKIHQLFSK